MTPGVSAEVPAVPAAPEPLPAGALLILRFSSLGDVILATAAAIRLKRSEPARPVVFVTRAAWAPLLRDHPAIDRVITLEGEGQGRLGRLTRFLATVRWAGVLDLHGSLRSRWLALRLPAGVRVRYGGRQAARRLLVALPALARRLGLDRTWRVVDAQVAAAERLLGRLPEEQAARGGAAAAAEPIRPSLNPTPAEFRQSEREWESLGLRPGVVGLCPGARHATKRWPVEYHAALADGLASAGQAAVPVFLSGDPDDLALEAALVAAVHPTTRLVILRRTLREVAAFVTLCRTIVTCDSGLMHLAAARGVPVVALFGPTVGAFGFRPAGPGHRVLEVELECRPCSLHGGPVCPRGHFRCLRSIHPAEVLTALGVGARAGTRD